MDREEEKFNLAEHFLTLSQAYFFLVRNVLEENIKQGNLHLVTLDKEISEKEYDEMTKWSDFNIFPILFNFYHGLELLMKGFLILTDDYKLKIDHDLEKALDDFISYYQSQNEIIQVLTKYLRSDSMPTLLSEWLHENRISISELYQFLRYPSDKKFKKEIDYSKLTYQEEKGKNLATDIVNDIKLLWPRVVKIYKNLEQLEQNDSNDIKICK